MLSVMQQLMAMAAAGLSESFFLHVAPNLGRDAEGKERLKPATEGDVGSTDIVGQLRGSIKEVGLLVLINRHIAARGYGSAGRSLQRPHCTPRPRLPDRTLQAEDPARSDAPSCWGR